MIARSYLPLVAVALFACAYSTARAADAKSMPDFPAVEKLVEQHFSALKGHQKNDLITREDVDPLFATLETAGWKVADQKEILQSLLANQHVLVKKLRTTAGKKFMRHVAKDHEGFDRLDRLLRLPRGERMLQDLIDGPDGHKLIDYMTKTSGGRELGKQLSNAPRGHDFNQETGRIYTMPMLIERLKASHAKAEQRAPR